MHENDVDEKLHENLVFNSGRSDLHGRFRGGQAELQKDRQELSDERQEGVQLRQRLRVRYQEVRRAFRPL